MTHVHPSSAPYPGTHVWSAPSVPSGQLGEAASYDAQFRDDKCRGAFATLYPGQPPVGTLHGPQAVPAGPMAYEQAGAQPMGPPMGLPMASQMGPPMAPPAAPYDGWASGYNGGHVMVGGVRPNHLMPGSYVQTNKVPAYIVCPHCRQQVLTKVKTRSSARTFVAAAAIFTVYWPLAFVPFVARPLKKKVHFCTRCGRNIGKVVTVTPA